MLRKTSIGASSHKYDSMLRLWKRSRAIVNGELTAKAHDRELDLVNYTNLLVPFSPKMHPEQYSWYVAEAELPGLTSQYKRVLLGGLLRKEPTIVLPPSVPKDAEDWIRHRFTETNGSLISFLDEALDEELQTSRGVVSVDFPDVANYDELTPEQRDRVNPYPVFWKAEDVINWATGTNIFGDTVLTRCLFRYIEEDRTDNPYHPVYRATIADYYLDDAGHAVVDYWIKEDEASVEAHQGSVQLNMGGYVPEGEWRKARTSRPLMHGEPLTQLPVFFLNGAIDPQVPVLTPLIDREIALYNKVSRRNHLLYGAATYTPVLMTEMTDEDFQEVVSAGLGAWIKLGPEDSVDVLKTPTEALSDYDRAIESAVAEMARLGIRILAPDSNSGDSGIALEIRNSAQTAQLGVLNVRVSQTMKEVISLMLRWKYGHDLDVSELDFELSADFNPAPIGQDWMRLITEWYEARLIPRSAFIKMAKNNDLLPTDYDDDEAIEEIGLDELVQPVEPEIQERI